MKTISYSDAAKLVEEGRNLPREERLKIQKERLRTLVDYVKEKSPYFKELYKDLKNEFSLEDLPPTHKSTLLENYDQWVTDPDLKKETVLKYLDRNVSDNTLLLGKYSALKTSGSTGNPLPMVRDDYHNKVHGALVNLRLMHGFDSDILNPSKHRIATVIHTSPGASSYNGYLRALAAFPNYAHNMIALSVLEDIDSVVKKLNEFKPDVMTGYASSLLLLAKEKKEGRLDIDLKMIANSAELLTDEAYKELTEAFGCPVINNYCMTEGGEIAMANGSPEMLLNEDWVIVEPVDKDLNPVENPDEFSEGILITDLSNFVQPIIRYHVGDRVKIMPPEDKTSLPELKIEGRTCEPFTLGGKQFTTVTLIAKAEVWQGLLKWQALQKDPNTIEMRGVCAPGYDPNEVLSGLALKLEEYFHENGCEKARFTYSDEPLLHNKNGGKIPRYIKLEKEGDDY